MEVNNFNSSEKIMNYLDKINLLLNCGKTLIVTELDLTNRCNNECPNCITKSSRNNAQLTWDNINKIIKGLKQLDNKGIILSGGGEPLLHPDFIATLNLISRTGMKIGLNSNGLALTSDKIDAIIDDCEYFRISLDAGTSSMYKFTHGMDEKIFDKVVGNMELVSKRIKEKGSKISFGAGFLTSKQTEGDMENFVYLCKEKGLGFAQFRPFNNDTVNIIDKYNMLKDKYEDVNFKVLASIQKYKEFGYESCRNYDKCLGMFFSTVITADAKMYACLHHRRNEKYLIGDVGNSTLDEIWNSSRKWKVFESIDMNDCPYFCRNDSFNRVLDKLKMRQNHSEFL